MLDDSPADNLGALAVFVADYLEAVVVAASAVVAAVGLALVAVQCTHYLQALHYPLPI